MMQLYAAVDSVTLLSALRRDMGQIHFVSYSTEIFFMEDGNVHQVRPFVVFFDLVLHGVSPCALRHGD
jgi:hypothetical protein